MIKNLFTVLTANQGKYLGVNRCLYSLARSIPESTQRHAALLRSVNRQQFQPYFNNKILTFSPKVKSLIQQISKFRDRVGKEEQMLKNFFQVHNMNVSSISPYDLLSLLVAINMHGNPVLLNFRKHIMQYILRLDFQNTRMDPQILHCFIDAFNYLTTNVLRKKKMQHLMHIFITVLHNHIDTLHFSYFPFVMKMLLAEENNKITYLKFAHRLLEQISHMVTQVLDERQTVKGMKQFVKDQKFILIVFQLASIYNCPPQSFKKLIKYGDKMMVQSMSKGKYSCIFLLQFYRSIPVRQRIENQQFYKYIILDRLIPYLNQIKFITDTKIHKKWFYHFCSTLIHHFFYQHWINLEFCQSDGIIYLEKQALTKAPQLPAIFWDIYSKNPQSINMRAITRETLKDCYPDKYKETEVLRTIQTRQPGAETEMRIRMEMALVREGISFEKQAKISQRFIDFLLQDKVIVQVDGMHHYYPHYFQNKDTTIYRNLHLLLAGYKLVIISIHEYNLHRQVDELANLLRHKLQKVREADCIAVL